MWTHAIQWSIISRSLGVYSLLILPCTRSRRHRGRGDPAGGWAGTPTGLWTTSVIPAHQHSSAPTADRWEDCDLTRPRSYRADDSPGQMDQEESTETKEHRGTKRIVVWWVTTASCLLDFVTIYSVRAAPLITVITTIFVRNKDLPASWARSCLAETLGMLWRCLLLPWQQSGWSGCYPLLQPLHHCCPLLPPGDRLADPTGYGTLVTQKGQKRKWTINWIRDNKGIRYKFLVHCRKPRKWM